MPTERWQRARTAVRAKPRAAGRRARGVPRARVRPPTPACATRSRSLLAAARAVGRLSCRRRRSTSSRGRSPAKAGACSRAIGSAPTRSSGGWAPAAWARSGGRATSGSARDVAIKLLLPHPVDDAERVHARFSDEARAAGTLNHTNVLTVYDVGDHGGAPYLVTECLEGESLRARLGAGAAAGRRRARRRAPGRARACRGARARHRPSRPEAGEHLPRARTAA